MHAEPGPFGSEVEGERRSSTSGLWEAHVFGMPLSQACLAVLIVRCTGTSSRSDNNLMHSFND